MQNQNVVLVDPTVSRFFGIRLLCLLILIVLISFGGTLLFMLSKGLQLKYYGEECEAKAGRIIPLQKTVTAKYYTSDYIKNYQEFVKDNHRWLLDVELPESTLVNLVYSTFDPSICKIGKKSDPLLSLGEMNTFGKWLLYCIYSILVLIMVFIISMAVITTSSLSDFFGLYKEKTDKNGK